MCHRGVKNPEDNLIISKKMLKYYCQRSSNKKRKLFTCKKCKMYAYSDDCLKEHFKR